MTGNGGETAGSGYIPLPARNQLHCKICRRNGTLLTYDLNGNSPVGFILNNVQYYYITNLYGDIMGIADSDGSVIARYSYDEWGKLLDIATAQENSEEQMAIAEINPLRYRGYYYDNETGMYYLQSRYYNPDLCRFISADGFDYINTSNLFSSNAYAYCWNNPVAFDDIEGTTPQISIDMQKVVSFFKNANDKALQKFSEHIEKLQIKFNAFIEKAKYYLLNPDELINNTLSKLFGREVKIEFNFKEKIKEFIDDLTENFVEFDKLNGSNGPQNEEESLDCEENLICFSTYNYKPPIAEDEKTNSWFTAVLKGLVIGINVDGITDFFESVIKMINKSFDFNKWYKGLNDSFRDFSNELMMNFVTIMNTIFSGLSENLLNDFYEHINDYTKGEIINLIFGEFFS